MSLRPVKQIIQPKPTIEGAGVKLQRAFGFGKTKDFDPFLLLDDFRNDNPADHVAGFPWHRTRTLHSSMTLEDSDRTLILETLEQASWIVGGLRGAAAKLGLKRTTLLAKMRRLGISRAIHQEEAVTEP